MKAELFYMQPLQFLHYFYTLSFFVIAAHILNARRANFLPRFILPDNNIRDDGSSNSVGN